MSQTDMIFQGVVVSNFGKPIDDTAPLHLIKVRRVSDEAQVTIYNKGIFNESILCFKPLYNFYLDSLFCVVNLAIVFL